MPPKTAVLAFDTSAAQCAAALLYDDRVVIRTEAMDRGQAERLIPFLQDMLADAGLDWCDLSALGVGVGPGNFTGIRIAVSAARGLALGLNIPAVGVGTIEAMAYQRDRPVTLSLPAPREQHYAQEFQSSGAGVIGLFAGPVPGPDWPATLTAMVRIAADRAGIPGLARPAPLYVRPADAAPASDPPPVILP